MKYLLVFYFIVTSSINASSIDEVRYGFYKIKSKVEIEVYENILKDNTSQEAKAYKAALFFMKAKFAFFPHNKFRYFISGKELLESTIKQSPNNVELKYIRFLFQMELPKILGYSNNTEEDFNFIIEKINKCDLNSIFKKDMLIRMSETKNLTDAKLKIIKLTLKNL